MLTGDLMKRYHLFFLLTAITLLHTEVIHIPADYATIQAGINASVDGDTVLVAPGIYYETPSIYNIIFVLASYRILNGDNSFIENTIIDASEDSEDPVIKISNTDATMVVRWVHNLRR